MKNPNRSILSIQSHVAYGYVGNKAAVFPLNSLGFDVWAVNTVQFSNHTGYGQFQGQVFSAEHVRSVLVGIEQLGVMPQCRAVLSGYLGSAEIGEIIINAVDKINNSIDKKSPVIYLCDPVMGDVGRGFFVQAAIPQFFKEHVLKRATIITPNHFEAEQLYGAPIKSMDDAKRASAFFHGQGVKIVLITSFMQHLNSEIAQVFLSFEQGHYVASTPWLSFETAPNGTGDLFAALYLGHYLQHQDAPLALQQAMSGIYEVLAKTHDKGQRELCVIEGNYRTIDSARNATLQKV